MPAPVPAGKKRGPVDHIIILDGTMSSLEPGMETNAGLIFKLLSEGGRVRTGRSITNPASSGPTGGRRATSRRPRPVAADPPRYGWLASHYRPGDRIWLFGIRAAPSACGRWRG